MKKPEYNLFNNISISLELPFNLLYASSAQGTYNFLDKNPVQGANLYRLKMADLNGTITYSDVVTLMYGNTTSLVKTGITINPNPTRGKLNLTVAPGFNNTNLITLQSPGASVIAYTIQIVNIGGSVVTKATTKEQNWQSDVSALMPGTYVIKVNNAMDNSPIGQGTFVKL